MKLFILPTVIILGWVLHHNIKKNKGNNKDNISSYLEREENANAIRRMDISNLPYIQVPLNRLPLDITLNDENMQSKIDEYKKNIYDLSEKKMLNLIGVSNLELKEQYGPANLEELSIYDQRYGTFIRTLSLYADCIYKEYPKEAVTICEYCINIGTDISGTYTLLGQYYMDKKQYHSFDHLYEVIPDKNSVAGKVIINKLNAIKNAAL